MLIALGILICIPLSKRIMDALYPYLVSNVACGIDLHMAPWVYAVLYLACMLIYAIIHALLVRRIRQIPANENKKTQAGSRRFASAACLRLAQPCAARAAPSSKAACRCAGKTVSCRACLAAGSNMVQGQSVLP